MEYYYENGEIHKDWCVGEVIGNARDYIIHGMEDIFKNVCFAPFVNKATKDGFRSFVKALNDSGYKKEAKYYETQYGDAETKNVNKTEYDIAVESGWLNIKQAALFLGVKYSSLLDMRKDDKILGQQRIPL